MVVGRGQRRFSARCGDPTSSVLHSCTGARARAGAALLCQSLDKIATASQDDRKAICQCFKDTARSFPVNQGNAQQLPQLCHVNVNVDIGPNVDCDREGRKLSHCTIGCFWGCLSPNRKPHKCSSGLRDRDNPQPATLPEFLD
ncbi:UNVERIFIED_CONTAM: hypothetical protein Scaly_1274700 [Sesamum calycinum]|uniref:Non-specific lipid-transfer protein n=1 Tax=Sesamum calycinum TaxID=2727403 RepID=A0AAW2Q6D4_9LAMI